MKINYDLYRPKKVIQDVYTPDNSYYNAKDVQVSPLTKIGDVADMPEQGAHRARQKARMLIAKLRPTFAEHTATKRSIPVRVIDTPITPKKYVLGKGVRSSFSLWGFVASMKYALLGVALLGTGVGFMVANLHGPDTVKSTSDKSSGNVEAAGNSHTAARKKPKAHAAQPPGVPATAPPQTQPQDTTGSTPATGSEPFYSSAPAASPSHSPAATPAPKSVSIPSATTQPASTPPVTSTATSTQPAPTSAPQPTPQSPAPTPTQPSTPTSAQPSGSTAPTTTPSTGSTTPTSDTSPSNTSTTTTTTTPPSPTPTP